MNRDIQTPFIVDNNKIYKSASEFAREYNVAHGYVSKKLKEINIGEIFNFRGHTIEKIK